MVTYVKTTRNQLETPSGVAGEPPDGPGNMQHLAQNIDDRLGVGGAEYAANYAAIQAIPAARCFEGKMAFAADTRYRYRYSSGGWLPWSTPWATLPLYSPGTNNIIANTFGYAPSWRITDGDVRIAGIVKKSQGNAFADGDILVNALPTAAQTSTVVYPFINGSNASFGSLQIQGASISVHSVKGTAPLWLALDGVSYRAA